MEIDPTLLRQVLDATRAAVIAVDTEGVVTYWSRGAERLYEYPAEEALGRRVRDLIFGPEASAHAKAVSESLATGRAWTGEFSVIRRNGTRMTVQLSTGRIHDEGGRYVGVIAVMVDVSERVHAAEALRHEQELLRSIIDNAPIVLFATDQSGMFTISRGRGLRALGVSDGEFVGRSAVDVYRDLQVTVGDQVLAFPEIFARVMLGESLSARSAVGDAHFDVWYAPRIDPAGAIGGMIGVALDVSARHSLEQRVRQAERLEALGLLAGGVAHDFNNLLTAILGHADIVLADLRDEGLRDDVLAIQHAAESAASVTRQLLAFTRRQHQELAPVDVNASVQAVQQLLRRTIGEAITVLLHLTPSPAIVVADPAQIEQVILNLAINAKDAMPQGGTLTISTAIVSHTHGTAVELTVADTGQGMSAATRERIFEPFFTTKERGRGTGLGLASVHGIVSQTGGEIFVESEPGTGTIFRILLPRAPAGPDAQRPAVESRAAGGAALARSILVVEDEDAVRQLISAMLTRAGYRVTSFADPRQAVAALETDPATYDLVLSDFVMPQMEGSELVRQVARVRPSLPVVLMSGYAQAGSDEVRPDIHKPFTREQLLDTIARRLAR